MEDLKEKFKYAKAFAEADESAERHSRTIFEFNKMLRSGKSSLECYQWLQAEKDKEEYEWQKKHGFPMHLDFYTSIRKSSVLCQTHTRNGKRNSKNIQKTHPR